MKETQSYRMLNHNIFIAFTRISLYTKQCHCHKTFRFSLELKSIRQGTETTVELSVGRLPTGLGQGGVVRWWRDGSRGDSGEGGLLIDFRQVIVGRPGCQLYLLIGDPICDGGFRLIGWPETSGHKSSG